MNRLEEQRLSGRECKHGYAWHIGSEVGRPRDGRRRRRMR
jgi:hypothetical protein